MDWRLIFLQSPANDGWYDENALPMQVWAWPQQTWLKKRLRQLREEKKGNTGWPLPAKSNGAQSSRENGKQAKQEAGADNFSLVPLLLAETDLPAETRRALSEGRRREAAELLMQTYGLSCSDAGELAGTSASQRPRG